MEKNYYKILGVSKKASTEEIKKAYRKLAHQHHPDKGGDENKFKEVNEAYQVLSNKEKRAQYDSFGQVFEGMPGFDFNQGGAGAGWDFGSGWQDFAQGQNYDFGNRDIGEIFEEFFGFGQKGSRKRKNQGQDIQIDIEIPLEETLTSQTKEISLYKYIFCVRCAGTGAEPGSKVKECFSCRGIGQVQQIRRTFLGSFTHNITCPECGGEGRTPEKFCNVCHGEGKIKKEENIKVFIPAGVDSNQVIKIKDKGEAGRRLGQPGDLYVRIFVKKHPAFTRKGDDLYIILSISFSQAALGDEIEISTLEGKKILLRISAGSHSGKILRISKKGIPHFSGQGQGSLYVELKVEIPKRLNKKQKELLRKLKEEGL